MEKEEFIRRYNDIKESVIEAMDEALTRVIGNEVIDFEKCVGNYWDVYPLIGAALQRELFFLLDRGLDDSVIRSQKRKATEYRNDYRIWHDYAGDYRDRR